MPGIITSAYCRAQRGPPAGAGFGCQAVGTDPPPIPPLRGGPVTAVRASRGRRPAARRSEPAAHVIRGREDPLREGGRPAPRQARRKVYSATFCEQSGNFYAVDSACNVNTSIRPGPRSPTATLAELGERGRTDAVDADCGPSAQYCPDRDRWTLANSRQVVSTAEVDYVRLQLRTPRRGAPAPPAVETAPPSTPTEGGVPH
jgi:hypothetical protein